MRKKDEETLKKARLFKDVPDNILLSWCKSEKVFIKEAGRGEVLLSSGDINRSLVVMLSGSAKVYKDENTECIIMSTLSPGDVYGMATLFYETSALPTKVLASEPCRLLVFPLSVVEEMMNEYPPLAFAYISLLSERIHFLGKRLGALTCTHAEERLLKTLSGFWKSGNTITVPYNMTELAQSLNVGRASLYRSLECLEGKGILSRNGKTITMLKPQYFGIQYMENGYEKEKKE